MLNFVFREILREIEGKLIISRNFRENTKTKIFAATLARRIDSGPKEEGARKSETRSKNADAMGDDAKPVMCENFIQGWEFAHQFSEQMNKWAICSKNQAICLSAHLLTLLIKKEGMGESLSLKKMCTNVPTKKVYSQIVLSKSLFILLFLQDL